MSILKILEEKLNFENEGEVLTTSALLKSGICQSNASAKSLLKFGHIPHINIGHRTLFAKKDVIEFLHKSLLRSCGVTLYQ